MKRVFYHATPYKNLESILGQGIKTGHDGVVYLCQQPEDAAKFVAIRGYKKILVLGAEIEEDMISESFDHSQTFFGCEAYTYPKDISIDDVVSFMKYEL